MESGLLVVLAANRERVFHDLGDDLGSCVQQTGPLGKPGNPVTHPCQEFQVYTGQTCSFCVCVTPK